MTRHYRILVSGSRNWPDTERGRAVVRDALITTAETLTAPTVDGTWPTVTLAHGGAGGLDRIAARVASELGMAVEAHVADWDQYGKYAGLKRNIDMVALGADRAIAFPIGESRGTRHCLRCIRAARIPVQVIEGEVSA